MTTSSYLEVEGTIYSVVEEKENGEAEEGGVEEVEGWRSDTCTSEVNICQVLC